MLRHQRLAPGLVLPLGQRKPQGTQPAPWPGLACKLPLPHIIRPVESCACALWCCWLLGFCAPAPCGLGTAFPVWDLASLGWLLASEPPAAPAPQGRFTPNPPHAGCLPIWASLDRLPALMCGFCGLGAPGVPSKETNKKMKILGLLAPIWQP